MSTLDEVISTVREARAEGPDALAAMALSFGATMVLGTVRCRALRGQIAEMRAGMDALEATVTTLRTERDAARDTAAQAAEVSARATRDWDAAFDALCTARSERDAAQAEAKAARDERDAAREALVAQDSAPALDYPARAEVWKLREAVDALRARAERAEAARDENRNAWAEACRERDAARSIAAMRDRALTAAVQEREAFSLRLSAAEHARDEARIRVEALGTQLNEAISRPTYEARETPPTPAERVAHGAAGARWLRCGSGRAYVVCVYRTTDTGSLDGLLWIPLGADGLPCAWPVVP